MTLPRMLADLPKACNVGAKRNARGHKTSRVGCKLHVGAADDGIPVSCILTSASVDDSQVATPLATMTSERVTNLHDLTDAACDTAGIGWTGHLPGHVPIVDINPRDRIPKERLAREDRVRRSVGHRDPKDLRYNERSNVERVNAMLKDDCGGRHVRVRGHAKGRCHLMFGILALTVHQLMRLLNRTPLPRPPPRREAGTASAIQRTGANRPRVGPCSRKTGLPTPPGRRGEGPDRRKFPSRSTRGRPGPGFADREFCKFLITLPAKGFIPSD